MAAIDVPVMRSARPPTPPRLFVGLDPAQKHDYTAIAIVSAVYERRPGPPNGRRAKVYTVQQLDRVRGESYETVADKVAQLMRKRALCGAALIVDETGVGVAFSDMLKARRLAPKRVTITAGTAVARDGNDYRVPKRDLVTAVEILLDGRRLVIPSELPLAETLVAELDNFKAKVSPLGHDSFGAGAEWREGAHDDLVLAVALACWGGENLPSGKVWSL